jgi:hypothetical protein
MRKRQQRSRGWQVVEAIDLEVNCGLVARLERVDEVVDRFAAVAAVKYTAWVPATRTG